jgi:hypothetical protein
MHDDSAGFEERRRWIQMGNSETFYLNVCALFVLMVLLLVCQTGRLANLFSIDSLVDLVFGR